MEFEYTVATVVASGVLAFVLGLFWYHPKVLGAKWMEARGKTIEDARPDGKQFIISFLLWLLAACFYAFLVSIIGIGEIPGFFSLSCLLWVAFAMPPLVMGALYTGYSFEAVSIDAAYQLAGYYVFAIVHVAMSALL